MQDIELYQRILGLSVQLDVAAQRVEVTAEHPGGTRFHCPECDDSAEPLPCYDHAAERQWRHLDSSHRVPGIVQQYKQETDPAVEGVITAWYLEYDVLSMQLG